MSNSTALFIVDVQNDFLPGGNLAVPSGDEIIEPLVSHAKDAGIVIASRDYHPNNHCSFISQGGSWPPHCIQGTEGALIDSRILAVAHIIQTKGDNPTKEEYSAFNCSLTSLLRTRYPIIEVGGLATDYCVKATVLDALKAGFKVKVFTDLIRAVNLEDGRKALEEMRDKGAIIL